MLFFSFFFLLFSFLKSTSFGLWYPCVYLPNDIIVTEEAGRPSFFGGQGGWAERRGTVRFEFYNTWRLCTSRDSYDEWLLCGTRHRRGTLEVPEKHDLSPRLGRTRLNYTHAHRTGAVFGDENENKRKKYNCQSTHTHKSISDET